MKKFKVGDLVWLFDCNRRVYPPNHTMSSGPIYSEHFYSANIEGETRNSYIVKGSKYSKKTNLGLYSEEDKINNIWDHENRYKIMNKIKECSISTLRSINSILNMEIDNE